MFYGALPLRYRGLIIPATRVDQIPQGLIALRTTAMLYRFTFTYGVNVSCATTTSFCKADEEFIHPNNFDLVMSGLFELKIHMDRRRIRTLDNTFSFASLFEPQITTRLYTAFVITA